MAQDGPSTAGAQARGPSDDQGASSAADRYAAALFDLALEFNVLDQVEKDLKAWTALWAGHKDLASVMAAPFIAHEEKAAAALKAAELFGFSQVAKNFLGLMAQKGRAAMIPAAIAAFGRKLSAHRGASRAIVSTPTPLSNEARAKIAAALHAATGSSIDLHEVLDPGMIGGLKVQIGSRQFDASIRTKLDNLKTVLKGA